MGRNKDNLVKNNNNKIIISYEFKKWLAKINGVLI